MIGGNSRERSPRAARQPRRPPKGVPVLLDLRRVRRGHLESRHATWRASPGAVRVGWTSCRDGSLRASSWREREERERVPVADTLLQGAWLLCVTVAVAGGIMLQAAEVCRQNWRGTSAEAELRIFSRPPSAALSACRIARHRANHRSSLRTVVVLANNQVS